MSDGHHPKPQLATLEELKAEIDRLFDLQHQALDRATYFGMTPETAKEVEARRKQITALFEKLVALKRSE